MTDTTALVPVCEDLKAHVPEIVKEWESITHEEPWTSLPKAHRIDELPAVAIGLFDAALCVPADPGAHRQKVLAAVLHGEQRREHGLPDAVLLTEFYLLREAIWRYLKRTKPASVADHAILRIDNAIMLATRAALVGYHRHEYEKRERWPLAVDRLIAEAPLLKVASRGGSPGDVATAEGAAR